MLTIQQMKDLYNEIAPRLTNYLVANGESYESAKDEISRNSGKSFLVLYGIQIKSE